MSGRVHFHVDLDAFYASVEQRDRPAYAGKPVVVGALPGTRGVVAACSYEARAFGIRSAMPVSEAYRRCPQAVYLTPRMDRYLSVSREIMTLFTNFSPVVHPVSIDEAFIDMSGTSRLFGPPLVAAAGLKAVVMERTGLSISVGIASNRLIAKMASEACKPNGLLEVPPGGEQDFVARLPVRKIWGIGEKTAERLAELRLDSVSAILAIPEPTLQSLMGRACGAYLYRAVRGIDPGVFPDAATRHSISTETTFEKDTCERELIEAVLLDLAGQVMFRLLEERCTARTITFKLRTADFTTTSAQTTLPHPVRSTEELFAQVIGLLDRRWDGGQAVRLLGVGVAEVRAGGGDGGQGELFQDRRRAVERTILDIRKKHSDAIVVRARLLKPHQ